VAGGFRTYNGLGHVMIKVFVDMARPGQQAPNRQSKTAFYFEPVQQRLVTGRVGCPAKSEMMVMQPDRPVGENHPRCGFANRSYGQSQRRSNHESRLMDASVQRALRGIGVAGVCDE
jgi:hypothetical protein